MVRYTILYAYVFEHFCSEFLKGTRKKKKKGYLAKKIRREKKRKKMQTLNTDEIWGNFQLTSHCTNLYV